MEKRGADVVSVEVTADTAGIFVPYPAAKLEEAIAHVDRDATAKESYWFSHAAHQSKQNILWGRFTICLNPRTIRHRSDGFRVVTLP